MSMLPGNNEIYGNYIKLRKRLYNAISGNSLYKDVFTYQKEVSGINDYKP